MSDSTSYVRLKPRYQLRGWKDIPHAVVDLETLRVHPLPEGAFHTIQFCNGSFTAQNPIFMGQRQKYLELFDKTGALEWLPEPTPLEPGQEYRFFDNLHITSVQWSITGHCNYRCRHCYMCAPHAQLPHPSTEQCLDIVDQIAACGISRVTITGGEPLIRSDFLQIVDRLYERGIRIDVLMTNGSLLTDELLERLKELDSRTEICLSYDGTRGWHDWLRGVDGAEEDFFRAMRLCHEHGFITCVETVLHKGNRPLLRETVKLLGELGADALKVLALSRTGEAKAIADYALTPEEFLEDCLAYMPQYVEDGMPVPAITFGPLRARMGKISMALEHNGCDVDCSQMAICGLGKEMPFLGPDGRILPCTPVAELDTMHDHFPQLPSTSLKQAFKDSSFTIFVTTTLEQYLDHNPRCAGCEYKNLCGAGCRAKVLGKYGGTDLLGVDEEMCSFFKDGYYERAKETIAQLEAPARMAWEQHGPWTPSLTGQQRQ